MNPSTVAPLWRLTLRRMKMDIFDLKKLDTDEYCNYRLPPEYWVAYMELRNWLHSNFAFTWHIHVMEQNSRLASAWSLLEHVFEEMNRNLYECDQEEGGR